jgi:hypothetical protein
MAFGIGIGSAEKGTQHSRSPCPQLDKKYENGEMEPRRDCHTRDKWFDAIA